MTFDQTRLHVIDILGFFWNKVFLDSDFVDGWASSIAFPLKNLQDMLDAVPNYSSRLKVPVYAENNIRLFVLDERTVEKYAHRYGDEGIFYGQQGLTYGTLSNDPIIVRYSFDSSFQPRFLTTNILNPSHILQLDTDYFIGDGYIKFYQNPLDYPETFRTVASLDADGMPLFTFMLWGFTVFEDIDAISNFFGTVAGVGGASSEKMKRSMNVAWDLRTDGASIANIGKVLAVLTDCDYVDKEGVVTEIFSEGNRKCVLTTTAVYTCPEDAVVLVSVGDTLSPGDIIFDAHSLKTGYENVDFEDFEALVLDKGYTSDTAPHGLLFQNTLTDIVRKHAPGWFTIVED